MISSSLLFIGLGLIVFGGAAVVFGLASSRGRDGSLWALLCIGVSVGVAYLAWGLAKSDDPSFTAVIVLFFAIIAIPVAFAFGLLKLPITGSIARGSRWELGVLGDTRDTAQAVLELHGKTLAIAKSGEPTVELGLVDVTTRIDGEALILEWADPDAGAQRLALISTAPTSKARTAFTKSLAKKINNPG